LNSFAHLKSTPASLSDRTDVELDRDIPPPPPTGPGNLKSVTKKGSARGPFYRLPDEYHHHRDVSESRSSSGDNNNINNTQTARPADADLRPDHGCAYTVTTSHGRRPPRGGNVKGGGGDGESLSGDEVPLHGIRVHTDFTQSAS
jgi:hypothetical protein